MWYLKSEHDASLFYLLAGKTYTVSRKQGDLVLDNDQSISRNHSSINISNEGEVFIWDKGSKYGTFVYEGGSEVKLEPQKRTVIKIGDKLRFGLQWNVYILGKMYFRVCTSSITVEEKRELKSLLPNIGGSFSNDWNDHCSHLAMNQVSLTHKVVLALAAGKPITTVQYWKKMLEAISDQLALPKIEEFLPPVGEEELQRQTSPDTLLPKENRKSLFEGKVFVFSLENTMSKIKALVECGGGVCQTVQTLKSPKICCEPNHIVVKESELCKQRMPDIFAALKRKGLRAVPVSEIGLAIYNNSLTRYCNPSWRKPVILGGPPSQSQGVCLVENTEDIPVDTQDMKVDPEETIVIPPSLGSVVGDTSIDSSRSVKRPLSTSPADNPPPKRLVQQTDRAKTSGTLHQWLQSSGSSSTKESSSTCSFDVSRGDLFETKSQRTHRDDISTSKFSQKETDLFKKPSPRKSCGVKRGRIDDEGDDIFEVPSPKKPSTVGKAKKTSNLPSPIKVINTEDDKLDETIEDDSDDEFRIPSRKKSPPLRIHDEDDEFELLPSFSKKSNRNKEDEQSRISEKPRETISLAPTKAVSRIEARVTESRAEARTTECRAMDSRPVTSIEASTMSNGRGNTSHAPSLSEFLDKSAGVHIKKEEGQTDEEILNINYEIGEMSLRTRPPLRDISSNSIIDGRPNFKKFRKPRLRTKRTRIDLVANDDVSMFEAVPGPDETIPNGSPIHRDEVITSQDVLAVFPFTNERNGPSRQHRVVDFDIVDDWTVP